MFSSVLLQWIHLLKDTLSYRGQICVLQSQYQEKAKYMSLECIVGCSVSMMPLWQVPAALVLGLALLRRAVVGWLGGSGGICHVGTSVWCCYLFWLRGCLVSPAVTVCSWSGVLKCKLRNIPKVAFIFISLLLLTVGPLTITFDVLPSERTIIQKNPFVQSGGHYRPPHCLARYKSAILVAYSNQEKYLHHLLYYIHPFLQRQQLSYRIYLIQQVNLNRICVVVWLSFPHEG